MQIATAYCLFKLLRRIIKRKNSTCHYHLKPRKRQMVKIIDIFSHQKLMRGTPGRSHVKSSIFTRSVNINFLQVCFPTKNFKNSRHDLRSNKLHCNFTYKLLLILFGICLQNIVIQCGC